MIVTTVARTNEHLGTAFGIFQVSNWRTNLPTFRYLRITARFVFTTFSRMRIFILTLTIRTREHVDPRKDESFVSPGTLHYFPWISLKTSLNLEKFFIHRVATLVCAAEIINLTVSICHLKAR